MDEKTRAARGGGAEVCVKICDPPKVKRSCSNNCPQTCHKNRHGGTEIVAIMDKFKRILSLIISKGNLGTVCLKEPLALTGLKEHPVSWCPPSWLCL